FFETVTKNIKNTKVEVILFESNIQYKEIAVKTVDTIINNQYIFYRNGKLELIKKQLEITNNSIVNKKSETNSKEDQ
ncbi:13621_t:CDS:1, partial [Dentiscutata heterogama]